jgi:putative intracellular protease/amidase
MSIKSPVFPESKKIGILVFNNFEPLDVWGFVEAFAISRFIGTAYENTSPCPFEITLIANEVFSKISSEKPQPIKSYNGPSVAPDIFRDQALKQKFDLLMIPGGMGVRNLLQHSNLVEVDSLKAWVQAMDKQVPIITSVCTGAAILAHAGVLDGKPAATNHQAFAWVTTFGPKVLWNNVARWVDAGKYVTSAGVSAGTDMAFHLVARLAGRAVAESAAIAAEYDWHRNPDQPIYYPQQASVPTSISNK